MKVKETYEFIRLTDAVTFTEMNAMTNFQIRRRDDGVFILEVFANEQ